MRVIQQMSGSLPSWYVLALTATSVLAQVDSTVTETEFVTVNDITTLYTCAPSPLPFCSAVTWDGALTSGAGSSTTNPVGPVTVTETATETIDPETVTETVDGATETDFITATVTETSTVTETVVPPIPSDQPFNLVLTDADGNQLNLQVADDGTVTFVLASENPNSEAVYFDSNGILRLVSDNTEVLYLIDAVATRRLRARQVGGFQMKAGNEDNLPAGARTNAFQVSADGTFQFLGPDGSVIQTFIGPDGQPWGFPEGVTPPAGFSAVTIGAAANNSVTISSSVPPATSTSSSMTSSSSSSSSSSEPSSSPTPTSTPLSDIITSYTAFCSTLLGQLTSTVTTNVPEATTTTQITTDTSVTDWASVTKNVTTSIVSNATVTSTTYYSNASPPLNSRRAQLFARQSDIQTPSALTDYSGAQLTSACQGAIGTTWTSPTVTATVTSGTTLATDISISNTIYAETSTLLNANETSYTATSTIIATSSVVPAQAIGTLRATVNATGNVFQYLVPASSANGDGSLSLELSTTAPTTPWTIDYYGRLGTNATFSGATAAGFVSDAASAPGTPGAARLFTKTTFYALVSPNTGYWLGFFNLADGSLVLDPHRNNPETPGDSSSGDKYILACTFSGTVKIVFSNTNTATQGTGTGCTEIGFVFV
ncbi:hypothetical protein TWF696_003490 [Orbilia brochopaga]|uniref:Uncharacterized protein n=1 Tax=Orbilia brochopaga TaxID=3140254 RepID=A0AAV9TZM8_9PEZI